jgi:non-ribosomal peptide synthetase component F
MRLTMTDDGTRIGGTLAYRTELFDPATVERMIGEYLALLQAAAADPDRPVAALLSAPPPPPAPERTLAALQPV